MKRKQVRDTYNQIADHFSKTRVRVWPETIKYFEKLKDGDRVLDLGCGNGRLLTGIKADIEYVGIDFSEELIKKASQLHPERNFIRADITQENNWKKLEMFDAIFCVAVLHHIPHREQQLFILNHAKKHLKKNGFLFISVWNLWCSNRLKHHFQHGSIKLKLKNWRWINTLFQYKWPMFCFAFDKKYLKNLLVEAGYKDIEVFYTDKKGESTNIYKGRNLCSYAK